jgi:hypothetical protein
MVIMVVCIVLEPVARVDEPNELDDLGKGAVGVVVGAVVDNSVEVDDAAIPADGSGDDNDDIIVDSLAGELFAPLRSRESFKTVVVIMATRKIAKTINAPAAVRFGLFSMSFHSFDLFLMSVFSVEED